MKYSGVKAKLTLSQNSFGEFLRSSFFIDSHYSSDNKNSTRYS